MSKSKTRQLEDALDCIDKIFDYVDDVIMAGHFGYDDDLESEYEAGRATVAEQVSEIIGTWRANE